MTRARISVHNPTKAELLRFTSRLRPSPDGCLEWTGRRVGVGYGTASWRGHPVLAHRLAYALLIGFWPERQQQIRHLCNNPPCCRLAHLEMGSAAENAADLRLRRSLAKLLRTVPLGPTLAPSGYPADVSFRMTLDRPRPQGVL